MLFDLSFAMRPVRHAVQFCSVINWSLRKKIWQTLRCAAPTVYQNLSKICYSGSRYAHQNLRERKHNPCLGQTAILDLRAR